MRPVGKENFSSQIKDQKFGPNREQCIVTCNVSLSSVRTGKSFTLGCNARNHWAGMNILL